MRISESFVIREIAGTYVIVPTEQEAQKFQGLISVNEVRALLWSYLQQGDMTIKKLTEYVCREYDVDEERVRDDVEKFIHILKERNMLIDD